MLGSIKSVVRLDGVDPTLMLVTKSELAFCPHSQRPSRTCSGYVLWPHQWMLKAA